MFSSWGEKKKFAEKQFYLEFVALRHFFNNWKEFQGMIQEKE
jgi:hypothetical protein